MTDMMAATLEYAKTYDVDISKMVGCINLNKLHRARATKLHDSCVMNPNVRVSIQVCQLAPKDSMYVLGPACNFKRSNLHKDIKDYICCADVYVYFYRINLITRILFTDLKGIHIFSFWYTSEDGKKLPDIIKPVYLKNYKPNARQGIQKEKFKLMVIANLDDAIDQSQSGIKNIPVNIQFVPIQYLGESNE